MYVCAKIVLKELILLESLKSIFKLCRAVLSRLESVQGSGLDGKAFWVSTEDMGCHFSRETWAMQVTCGEGQLMVV